MINEKSMQNRTFPFQHITTKLSGDMYETFIVISSLACQISIIFPFCHSLVIVKMSVLT